MLVLALSDGQVTAIALGGAAFIAFALVSSLLIPHYRPSFPGRHVIAYVALASCFFVGMMLIIVFAAREKPEARAEAGGVNPPAQTTPAVPKGDAAAGKALFTAQGCSQCHTFTPAGAKGTIGPNLDKLRSDAKTANRGSLEQYTFESIDNPGAYVVPGFSNGIMPRFGQTLKKQQIADLVAYLTQT